MARTNRHLPRGMAILHEDNDILVVDKPAGLLSVGTDREKVKTAYYVLTNYVRKGYAKSRKQLFIVHRLDQGTSGVLIFAKTAAARKVLQDQWEDTTKIYLAVVQGKLSKKEDTITTYLAENRAHIVYSTPDPKRGKLSKTAYRVLQETREFSLLEIDLITGRKNQIRVHLADLGHPVVGDKKYGKGNKAHKRLALHAKSISFKHPSTGKPLTCEAEVPKYITTLVGTS